uniref:Uncharacterized protein n=1 Tax=Octopus bimaculoides TaxID=37653 RepID=A0A0L8HSH5_OCTBM
MSSDLNPSPLCVHVYLFWLPPTKCHIVSLIRSTGLTSLSLFTLFLSSACPLHKLYFCTVTIANFVSDSVEPN